MCASAHTYAKAAERDAARQRQGVNASIVTKAPTLCRNQQINEVGREKLIQSQAGEQDCNEASGNCPKSGSVLMHHVHVLRGIWILERAARCCPWAAS